MKVYGVDNQTVINTLMLRFGTRVSTKIGRI